MATAGTRRVVVLTGPICAGKTTLAAWLLQALPASVVSARALLAHATRETTRRDLQAAGSELERSTGGRWLAQAVGDVAANVVVDSARTTAQVGALRELDADVAVIHLDATIAERRRRFDARSDPLDTGRAFDDVVAGELNEAIAQLESTADLAIQTDGLATARVCAIAFEALTGGDSA